MKQTISLLVEHRHGVLNQIISLLNRRAFKIESLSMGVADDPSIYRITIVADSGNNVDEQVGKQLDKLVSVIKVHTFSEGSYLARELMMIKVNANDETRPGILAICSAVGAKVDDVTPTTMTIELTEDSDKVDSFKESLRPFGIVEVVRTGIAAVRKGESRF